MRVVAPTKREPVAMSTGGDGWFEAAVKDLGPGARYFYVLDWERDRPDPASRAQPEGVHGPSVVVDPAAFAWTDAAWRGLPLAEMVIYELHVGTFTPEGTFDAIIPRLEALRELGITALELMPVASFPGERNWGYDGVHLYAPQQSYGGPEGLRRLVDAAHAQGLAVVLDVVYNHLGPEGNYLAEFGPYFTDRYRTPWGGAVNYDGEGCGGVRRHVIENALHWVSEYHVDGLRLDAIHGIFDAGAVHILHELNDAVQSRAAALGRIVPVVAESDLNDRRVIDPVARGGYGLAGQWNDDFHHALHAVLTGERQGYYADFGELERLAKAFRDGFVYEGQFSRYRGRSHGTPTRDLPGGQFVVFAQNHDQVGNRAWGERLTALVPFEALKLAAAALLWAPNVPLLFMGEEYGETAPFLYFTDFGDPALAEAVRRGRRDEFRRFAWAGEVPDPQDMEAYGRSKLRWDRRERGPHAGLCRCYRDLLGLRRAHPALAGGEKRRMTVTELPGCETLSLHRWEPGGDAVALLLHFGGEERLAFLPVPPGEWRCALDTAAASYGGAGAVAPAALGGPKKACVRLAPWNAVLYVGVSDPPVADPGP